MGVSGNPRGRPRKGQSFTEALRDRSIGDKRKLAAKLWQMALAGNLRAIMYLIDRLEGKPVATQFQGELRDIPLVLGWNPPMPDNRRNDSS